MSKQPYLRGNLLSTEWLRAILIHDRPDEFEKWLKNYYEFLGQRQQRGQALSIDLLPLNIVVSSDGEYQVFDQEWETRWDITRDYVLFRALWGVYDRMPALYKGFSKAASGPPRSMTLSNMDWVSSDHTCYRV